MVIVIWADEGEDERRPVTIDVSQFEVIIDMDLEDGTAVPTSVYIDFKRKEVNVS